ncbi:MAG: LPS assembly protein LptD, partial [Smithella sp.]
EITFTGIKQPILKSPVYYDFNAVYDYYYRGEGQKGHIVDVNPNISIPFNISRYAKIIPQLSLRETFWDRDDDVQDGLSKTGTRSIYNFSMAMTSQISRIFDTNILNWNKVRHEIKPELTYSYTPNVSQTNLPDFAPIITPIVLPVTAPTTNAIMEQNAFSWGLTNTFIAKTNDAKGNSSYLEFLRVKLLQTYDINEAKRSVEGVDERRPFSDMTVEVDFRPHSYLFFQARNKYSVYDGWKVMNYDATISDRRGDSATVSYRYTMDSIEEFDVSLKAVITDKLNGTFISRRDLFNSRNVETALGLVYYSQCWAVGFEVSTTDSLQPDSSMATDTRFVFKFSLTGLAKFGL